MTRFQARNVPFARLYNAVVYAISAIVFSAILATIEFVSPGEHVFLPNDPYRDPFILVALCSWALLGTGAVCILVLYFPSKPRDKKRSSRYPEVTFCVLAMFFICFLAIAVGLMASVAAGVLVFRGQRNRYRVLEATGSTFRAWLVPLATGALPALFFAFMAVSMLRSALRAAKDMRLLLRGGTDGLGGEKGPAVREGLPVDEGPGDLSAPLTPEQEDLVRALQAKGFNNRNMNVGALRASGFDLAEAERRLLSAAGEHA